MSSPNSAAAAPLGPLDLGVAVDEVADLPGERPLGVAGRGRSAVAWSRAMSSSWSRNVKYRRYVPTIASSVLKKNW